MHKGTCRSCGAEILWAVTESGKKMPVDAKPIKVLVRYGLPTSEQNNGAPAGFVKCVDGYVSHFATCPNADRHRRRPSGEMEKGR